MRTAPPTADRIDSSVATAERGLRRGISRRRNLSRAGIGAGALVVLGIAGSGAATAFFPQYYDLQGVVKTQYADDFVDCIRAAGWDAQLLNPAEAAPILENWGADASTSSIVTNHLAKETQGESGRAISLCQEQLADEFGEGIMTEF
ncbi:MAG: hypothetical protein JWQ43_3083 [Glaciihabitans sp.]|nr:hypothetical protein [Glaciihabitans sp.]